MRVPVKTGENISKQIEAGEEGAIALRVNKTQIVKYKKYFSLQLCFTARSVQCNRAR